MSLYFIGLGLSNEKDITVRGLELVKKCDVVYLEYYTSVLNCSKEDLEKFYGKEVVLAPRDVVEGDDNQIINDAKDKEVAFLVAGDPLIATTHMDLYLRAKKEGINCEVVHNASVLNGIGQVGLQAYKYGKVTSIPMDNENVETPYTVLSGNLSLGMHTLFLLDLRPTESKFMSINSAIEYLLKVEDKKKEGIFTLDTLCVGCAQLGSSDQVIKFGKASELREFDFGKEVHCLVVPGNMHFMEEEAVRIYS